MDIWSRLLGGSPSKKAPNTPEQRLIRFKKEHDKLQLIWRRNNASADGVTSPEPLYACLHDAREILQHEVQTPAPHLCARHVATFHIYSTMAQLASIYPDEGIIQETLGIFNILLDSEEGDFLKDRAFADALIGFISTISAHALPVDTEATAVEVLYHVTAKVRSEPQLLSTWFRPGKKGWALPTESRSAKEREEFYLFYLILDFIHHDGRTGDFARTGLLYLIECASHSAALEQWIIESDLATLIASGLGALYSQLSRKLIVDFGEDSMPPIIAFSQEARPHIPNGVDKSSSPDFKSHLHTFLSYLAFWQDVLEHCSSIDIKQSLLDHFKFLFLQQLLYPSLIESSDRDGGSSVAVLTYLKCIIESINHPDLVRLTFEYLLAIDNVKVEEKPSTRPTAMARRRRSQSLLTSLSQGQEQPIPNLFNLDDLMLSSLSSSHQQTVSATLRLISTMLQANHQYDVSLIKMGSPENTLYQRNMTDHNLNTKRLFRMIEILYEDPGLRDAHEIHLEDAQNLLECHPCSLPILAVPQDGHLPEVKRVAMDEQIRQSLTKPDPILSGLISLLDDFFSNDIETNLCLTQVFSSTTSCVKRSLDGWFIGSRQSNGPSDFTSNKPLNNPDEESSEPESDPSSTSGSSKTHVSKVEQTTPMFAALDALVAQVETFRRNIENFDIFLAERSHVFKVGEDSDHAIKSDNPSSRKPSAVEASRRASADATTLIGAHSGSTSTVGSRPQSPRGRKQEGMLPPNMADRLTHLKTSPSRSPALAAKRGVSPSPLRHAVHPDSPIKQPGTPMGPPDALSRKIRIKVKRAPEVHISDVKSDASSVRSEMTGHDTLGEQYKEVSLSHVLTNVIILQEFLLELVAIIEVRASIFGEVKVQ